jgi:hypothetical protein
MGEALLSSKAQREDEERQWKECSNRVGRWHRFWRPARTMLTYIMAKESFV